MDPIVEEPGFDGIEAGHELEGVDRPPTRLQTSGLFYTPDPRSKGRAGRPLDRTRSRRRLPQAR